MTARRYEISFRVLKNKEKRNFVSPSGHVMFCLLYSINTNEIPNHCKRRDLLCNHTER